MQAICDFIREMTKSARNAVVSGFALIRLVFKLLPPYAALYRSAARGTICIKLFLWCFGNLRKFLFAG